MTGLYDPACFEAPVVGTMAKSYIHYQKGRKTGEQAIIEPAAEIHAQYEPAPGQVIGFAVTGAVALLGAGPLLVTIAPILNSGRSSSSTG